MNLQDIPRLRLFSQHLSSPDFNNPEDVVSHFGAVQSQDFSGAKWAVGLRMKDSSEEVLDQAFNEGMILRTHILRPTWHFVHPSDIRWMEMVSRPQVSRMMKYYEKNLELDEIVYKKSAEVFQRVLAKKNFLTREQLGKELEKHGISAKGQKLGHIVFYSELTALICSGPRIGKQFSYALVDELVPPQKSITREEALEKLLIRFFNSRGAATLKDFAKWSMINLAEIKQHTSTLDKRFPKEVIEGEVYYLSPLLTHDPLPSSPFILLLPNYDEYISSYADFSAIYQPDEKAKNVNTDKTPIFWNTLLIDGVVAGSWRREIKGKTIEFQIAPLRDLSKKEKDAVEEAVQLYGQFFSLTSTFTIT